jgi:hypothetical protein
VDVLLDYGYRSKCCKAAIRMGKKKITKTNEVINVWVCCACKTKDVDVITREEALQAQKPRDWWDDESDDNYSE